MPNAAEKPKKKITLTLKDVPDDVYGILIDEQARVRKEIKSAFGLEATIYKLIRKNK